MSNLPIEVKDKLNIWQKLRIRISLLKKYDIERYNNAPDYIKNSELVQENLLKNMIDKKLVNRIVHQNVLKELFLKNSSIFDEKARRLVIDKIIYRYNGFELIELLTDNEQQEILLSGEMPQEEILPYLRSSSITNIIEEIGEKIKFCAPDVQRELIEEKRDFILLADEDVQKKFFEEHIEEFESLPKDIQEKILVLIKTMPREIQYKFASLKRENLGYIKEDLQIQIVQDRTKESKVNAFQYANEEAKDKILLDEENIELLKELIYQDYKNIKYIRKRDYKKHSKCKRNYLTSIKDEIEEYDSEKIKDIFIKGGMLFAKGNLRTVEGSWQGNSFELSNDIYTKQEVDIIQLLNPKQMAKLIEVDSNYILPYVIETGWDKRLRGEEFKNKYKEKCKAAFLELYGVEKLKEYDECIDEIFQKALEFENKSYRNTIAKESRSPLESLKLLFNKKIIESNSPELIKQYYSKLLNEKIEEKDYSIVLDDNNANEVFKQIILNTYGEDAVDIMNSRKELDIYTINSLEVFDQRILNNFDKEFVHDLLSYNIDDFSAFLNIIKNEKELKLFKEYYDLLSQAMGKNVEVIQKAISEFYYVSDLLKDIEEKELTEKQRNNLISCICGERNQYNIENLEQLDNYIKISNEQFKIELRECKNAEEIKACIFSNVFGIKYKREFEDENVSYGDTIDSIMNLYEINTDELELTEDEKDILDCINFIYNEESAERLLELAEELQKKEEIKNPIALYSTIQKIKEKGIEVLNKTLITKEEIDRMCEDSQNEGIIRKEINDGVEIYYFDGAELPKNKGLLIHHNKNSYGRNIMESESQLGMSTISTYYASQPIEDIINTSSNYIYTSVESEDLLGSFATNGFGDASTSHIPKVVKASAEKRKIKETIKTRNKMLPEISFYRRTRNHDRRNKEKMDGRIKPSFICVINYSGNSTSSIEDISKEKLDEAKKYGIPIIVINKYRYVSKERNGYER